MYHFIVNPGSRTGKGQNIWNSIEKELKKRKIGYKVYFTQHAGHAAEYATQICSEETSGSKKIVIVGGDGTANEAINGLTNLDQLTLGYIPTGSGNDLARGLGIPREPLEALNMILAPTHFKYCDIGTLSYSDGTPSRRFAVSSGIGYDADICYKALTSKLKNFLNKIHLGRLIYFIIGIQQVIVNKPVHTVITIDDAEKLEYNKLIFVANMIHRCEGGGLPMGPSANPCDEKLTCCIVHDIAKPRLLCLMPTIFAARHVNHKGVDMVDCSKITIETDTPLVLHTDGEFAGKHTKVTLSCKDKLRFITR